MNENISLSRQIKVKVRYDFMGHSNLLRSILRGKDAERLALKSRERQATYFRNVPIQGLVVESVCDELPSYQVVDEDTGLTVCYAPLEIVVQASSIADLLRHIVREELSQVQLLEPDTLCINRLDAERMIFQLGQAFRFAHREVG